MFCMQELARIMKQQSYPNGAPCRTYWQGGQDKYEDIRSVSIARFLNPINQINSFKSINQINPLNPNKPINPRCRTHLTRRRRPL